MAPRKTKSRRAPKRRAGRRRAARPNGFLTTTKMTMTAPVRPDRLLVKMPYSSQNSMVLTAGRGNSYVWNMNSIYDPDRSGVGHQPLGHDQWAAFYDKYRVYRLSYDITLTNMNADSPIQCGLGLAPAAFGSFTDQGVFEQSHIKRFTLSTVNAGGNTRRLRGSVSLPQIIGQTSTQYKTDIQNAATFNNNPSTLCCLNILARAVNQGVAPVIFMAVTLTYHVECFQPPPIPLSSTAPSGASFNTFGATGPTGLASY